mgnify:FL=1
MNLSLPPFWPPVAVSGVLLLLTWALTLADTLNLIEATNLATLLAWAFLVIELPRLNRKQRLPILILIAAGFGFALWAWSRGGGFDLLHMMREHLKLVMLLAAVNFIRLATRLYPGGKSSGIRSFGLTLGGMHLFSSVANFSSLVLIGDQIQRHGRISPLSYILLSRGFSLAIFWSPFLSMIPLILEQVPGVQMPQVYPWALTLVVLAMVVTLIEAKLRYGDELATYQGYPLRPASLFLPGILIGTLLISHRLFPNTPMVAIVSAVAVLIPTTLMGWRNGLAGGLDTLKKHITTQLPNGRPEVSLFLAAGFLAAGVKACISSGLISFPFEQTSAMVAIITMLAIVIIASLGVHQFALFAIFAGLMHNVTATPTLMAIAYIMGVSLSMSGSVFSGLNFIVQGQYQVGNREILRHNLPYTLLMLLFTSLVLLAMEAAGIQ